MLYLFQKQLAKIYIQMPVSFQTLYSEASQLSSSTRSEVSQLLSSITFRGQSAFKFK